MDKTALIREVRERTHISMNVCRQALEAMDWDLDRTLQHIKDKNLGSVDRGHKVASEGIITSYVHNGKVAVLVEVNVETDFAAKSDDFRKFCENVALQVCAMNPDWVSPDMVPLEDVEHAKALIAQQAAEKFGPKAPAQAAERFMQGKLAKWHSEHCLLEMTAVMDPQRTIRQMLDEVAAKVREKVVVRRFARWVMGEGIEKVETAGFANEALDMAGMK